MSRLTQAVLLLLFGGAILKASLTDVHLRYVKPQLQPFLLVAGAVLVAAAVMTLWHELRPAATGHHHDHDHEPRVGWLLLLPVLGLLLVTPPALGSFTAGQAGTVPIVASDSIYEQLPPGDPVPIGLMEYASRAVFDEARTLTGREVQLTGFVTAAPDGTPMLARIVLACCAADGRPIKVGLTGGPPVDAAEGSWIRVTGVHSPRVGRDPVNDGRVAYLEVRRWEPIETPKRQYE